MSYVWPMRSSLFGCHSRSPGLATTSFGAVSLQCDLVSEAGRRTKILNLQPSLSPKPSPVSLIPDASENRLYTLVEPSNMQNPLLQTSF